MRLDRASEAIEANARLFDRVLSPSRLFINSDVLAPCTEDELEAQLTNTSELDMDNVRTVLKQLGREWSEVGAEERRQSFSPIINAVQAAFPGEETRPHVRILVPGTGLGRLAWELANRRYCVQVRLHRIQHPSLVVLAVARTNSPPLCHKNENQSKQFVLCPMTSTRAMNTRTTNS